MEKGPFRALGDFRIGPEREHIAQVFPVHPGPQIPQEPLGPGRRLVHERNAQHVDFFHFRQHALGGLQGDLPAVRAVHLVAVVLLGVVAGRNHDARGRAQAPDREGQLRGGAQAVKQVDPQPALGQHQRALPGELPGAVARVVGDGHPLFRRVPALGEQVPGQAQRGPPHHIPVHAVDARAQHPAQPAGAELQVAPEPVEDLVRVVLYGNQLVPASRVQPGVRKKCLIDPFSVHSVLLY